MGRAQHSLLDDDSVKAWIAENEPDGLDKLMRALEQGHISGQRASFVRSYLASLQRAEAIVQVATRDEREQHIARLIERSTVAAEDSAKAATRSAKWAGWALFVSIAALIVAGWQHIAAWLQ